MAGSAVGGQMMRTLGFEAAHIVPFDLKRAAPIRDLLKRNGFTDVDIKYGPSNGVWLPGSKIKADWPSGTWHQGGSRLSPSASKHSQDAMNEILSRLQQHDGYANRMEEELQLIGQEWQNGIWGV
jgi:A nuclease family of the HNH/ENDO VII superfamily with conserved AHH